MVDTQTFEMGEQQERGSRLLLAMQRRLLRFSHSWRRLTVCRQ
jgi:hypothetical protein